jgi:hypothetical protein
MEARERDKQAAALYSTVGNPSKKPPKPNPLLDQSQTSFTEPVKAPQKQSGKAPA